MGPFQRAALRLLLGIAVGAAVVGAVELSLRAAGVDTPYRADTASWRMKVGLVDDPVAPPGYGHPFTLSTNEDGLRTPYRREAASGARRVVLMGDSTVLGWGVDDDETIAHALQWLLDGQADLLGPVEVVNAGHPGYSSAQVGWLFDQVVRHYLPSVVLVFVPLHDGNFAVVSDREALAGGEGPGARVRIALARHSRIYQVLRLFLYPRAREAALRPLDHDGKERRVPRVSDAERAAVLDEMHAALALAGGSLMVGLLPAEPDLKKPFDPGRRRPDQQTVEDWARARGAVLVDLQRCCGPGGDDLLLERDPGHFSAAGNERMAAEMAPRIALELTRLGRVEEGG